MRPFRQIVLNVLRDQVIEVVLAKDDEVVEAFVLDRLNPPLDEGVLIRAR